MDYEYDIFISYRRQGFWPLWVTELLRPQVAHWLETELGREVKVFADSDLESGTLWPVKLAHNLARSKIVIPLFSRGYASSPWCRAELAHMFAREDTCGFRTPLNPDGLVVPATIHDGEHLPAAIRQRLQIKVKLDQYTAIMNAQSPNFEGLRERVRCWAPEIAAAVDRAPPYDEVWQTLSRAAFEQLLDGPEPKQTSVPSLGGP
jgi:hypothetical protein